MSLARTSFTIAAFIAAIVQAVDRTDEPIVEVGAGDGALTCALQDLGRPTVAVVRIGLVRKVSASSFRPQPSVDGGLMTISRRADPLVETADRRRYQAMVHQVFTGRGHGIAQILARRLPRTSIRNWLRDNKVGSKALPRDLSAAQWAALFTLSRTNATPL
jgi:16S rRNA A1518/A1519 N6-dimethyltransferase RsmA/KsgA/DIM1 with predicted DNA glycosylase/AP lyase activity